MSRNIKEIGKELLGKSLNSFHRKTGLTQLEKNNEMQDGILDGILSQVNDAYIEKTEQSNVIRLEGSGDGIVVVDSVEGNTMVNLMGKHTYLSSATYDLDNDSFVINQTNTIRAKIQFDNALIEPNKTYTVQFNIVKNTLVNSNTSSNKCAKLNLVSYNKGNFMVELGTVGTVKAVLTQPSETTHNGKPYFETFSSTTGELIIKDFVVLEGDWSDREIPTFKGLQSSFEENKEEDKYKIEILSNNKNLYNVKDVNIGSWMNSGGATVSKVNDNIVLNGTISDYFDFRTVQNSWNPNITKLINKLPVGTTLTMSNNLTSEKNTINYWSVIRDGAIKYFTNTLTVQKGDTGIGGFVRFQNGTVLNNTILKVQIEVNNKATSYTISKQNKIKLLLNSPLLKGDKLVVKDGKLCHYHKRKVRTLKGDNSEPWQTYNCLSGSEINTKGFTISYDDILPCGDTSNLWTHICDKLPTAPQQTIWSIDKEGISTTSSSTFRVRISRDKATTIQELRKYLSTNPITVCYELLEPYYEEVLNEYGEPIILEGYENGTLYIDSTVIPTTTVRYTPKMESFKTLNEVNNNNIMLTNDIDDNIIPYMMDVDLMIMEKEMALMSQYKIRRIGAKDMTSMQKRTQDMLERLIKGKTLTEQECKTRVTTYLNAGKITDEQAEELMLLIDEVYA